MTARVTVHDAGRDESDALLTLEEHGRERARLSVRWRGVPAVGGARAGFVGHWRTDAEGSGDRLLAEASRLLRARGCRVAVGPVDGSTWRRYRFTVGGSDAPPFVLEPDYPEAARRAFVRAGFRPLAGYASRVVPAAADAGPRAAALAVALAERGVRIRALDPARFAAEVLRLHPVASEAFRDAFLYTPIDRDAFAALYRPLEARIVPDLMLLAERGERLVGFLLALPDAAQAARGGPVDTLVLKTLGVLPEERGHSIGAALMARAEASGAERRLHRVIHALVRDGNRSTQYAGPAALTLRRYVVCARALSAA